jgi:hypothetical protein
MTETKKTSPAKRSRAKKEEPEAEVEQPDAIVITKIATEDGGVTTDVTAIGGVQVTEVQTLIELGLARWRAKIGLDG